MSALAWLLIGLASLFAAMDMGGRGEFLAAFLLALGGLFALYSAFDDFMGDRRDARH